MRSPSVLSMSCNCIPEPPHCSDTFVRSICRNAAARGERCGMIQSPANSSYELNSSKSQRDGLTPVQGLHRSSFGV